MDSREKGGFLGLISGRVPFCLVIAFFDDNADQTLISGTTNYNETYVSASQVRMRIREIIIIRENANTSDLPRAIRLDCKYYIHGVNFKGSANPRSYMSSVKIHNNLENLRRQAKEIEYKWLV